jgi:hypothetical protein
VPTVGEEGSVHVFVKLDGSLVPIERDVFVALFHNSVMSGRAGVRDALAEKPLPFTKFVDLARGAEIPYPLFFAPMKAVEEQLRLKNEKLMAGFTKSSFSMHSRNKVELRDIELIVKDLLRKQELLRRYDQTLAKNDLVGLVKRSRRPVVEDAHRIAEAVGFDLAAVRKPRMKEDALAVLIGQLEAKQIFVSQSTRLHMPQQMPKNTTFSGITIKDKKVPFIFLASGDEGEGFEPAGRRVYTLMLLTVLIAQGTFAPVTYAGHTKDEESPRANEVTAELLMPAAEMRVMRFPDLQTVIDAGNVFKVTPSAVAMRARRLQLIDYDTFSAFMDALQNERPGSQDGPRNQPLAVNALKKYNGAECSRRMLGIMDAGHINASDFRRFVLLNKLPSSRIDEYRVAVG